MKRSLSIADARKNLAEVVRAAEGGEVVVLTRRGKPVAVFMSTGTYEGLTDQPPDLWESVAEFRKGFDLAELDIEGVYRDTRDRSTGRKVRL